MKDNGSIARKNGLRLSMLGIFLILGIGAAVGIQFYRQNMSIYTDMAYSYARLATNNISGAGLNDLIERGEDIRSLFLEVYGRYDSGTSE